MSVSTWCMSRQRAWCLCLTKRGSRDWQPATQPGGAESPLRLVTITYLLALNRYHEAVANINVHRLSEIWTIRYFIRNMTLKRVSTKRNKLSAISLTMQHCIYMVYFIPFWMALPSVSPQTLRPAMGRQRLMMILMIFNHII